MRNRKILFCQISDSERLQLKGRTEKGTFSSEKRNSKELNLKFVETQ
jgi:hypothetical protein